MTKTYENLIVTSDKQGIFIARFNRPDAANALNIPLSLNIKDFFTSIRNDKAARAVILTGEGKHFCAGADLKERKGMNQTQWNEQHHAFEEALQAVVKCGIPVIAAVNGAAMGGGLELALASDFIYAADNARFALTEVTLGIMPGMGGTQTLPRAVGMKRAKELIYTGRVFLADEALEWGMVNKVVSAKKLLENAIEIAQIIAANAPLSIKACKESINQGIKMSLPDALQYELSHYATLLDTKDRHEGINAFNEKRKPSFTGE